MKNKPTIILVHGAWADGSSWSKVIPMLRNDGYHVVATQHSLTSLADDVEVTRRLAERQNGPVVLVGHSYGGAIITEAAAQIPNTAALVYIAAFAPDEGESLAYLAQQGEVPPGNAAIRPDGYGTLWLDTEQFAQAFCQDVTKDEAAVMAAVQMPIAARCFEDKITNAGWRNIPSWYQVSEYDRMIPPAAEKFMAERIKARQVVSLPASHAPMVSHPKEIARLILHACHYTGAKTPEYSSLAETRQV